MKRGLLRAARWAWILSAGAGAAVGCSKSASAPDAPAATTAASAAGAQAKAAVEKSNTRGENQAAVADDEGQADDESQAGEKAPEAAKPAAAPAPKLFAERAAADGAKGDGAPVQLGLLGGADAEKKEKRARTAAESEVEEKPHLADQPARRDSLLEADKDRDGGGSDQGDACGPSDRPQEPLPRRCHLASNYRAGQGIWQRRLESLASLPAALRNPAGSLQAPAELLPPETKALAVAARLDREGLEGPGQVWMRVSLRSTDRWGMRRPPFDLAVVVGPDAAKAADAQACRTLEALVQRVEPQDRLTLVRGRDETETLDGIAGAEALARVRAVCASGAGWASAPLADQHRRARQLLARHAEAQHRVAGSRLVVVIATAADLADASLQESAAQAVAEPTLTSALVLDSAGPKSAGLDQGWQLADAGHGLLEPVAQDPDAAARRLWHGWGRIVARLVRVDLRLAPGVVALRVVGSRVLDQAETQRVRRQETAVDQNLARVAGVKTDRQQDGEGMTMLIAAFLGSDEHVIDVLLQVPGPGPVADVVVDYKDLVRMANEKAMARAALPRGATRGPHPPQPIARPELDHLDWPQLAAVRHAVAQRDEAALRQLLQALQQRGDQQPLAEFVAALAEALGQSAATEPLLAAVDVFVARGRGCHVAAGLR